MCFCEISVSFNFWIHLLVLCMSVCLFLLPIISLKTPDPFLVCCIKLWVFFIFFLVACFGCYLKFQVVIVKCMLVFVIVFSSLCVMKVLCE